MVPMEGVEFLYFLDLRKERRENSILYIRILIYLSPPLYVFFFLFSFFFFVFINLLNIKIPVFPESKKRN